jgi:uridylate kinase
MCANALEKVAELYLPRTAREYLDQGRVVLVAGGTGNPFFTTDTAAALRCAELGADVLLKATKVDGVYDDDPMTNPQARLYERVTYNEVIDQRLRVMDVSAIDVCQRHQVPVIVFNLFKPGTMRRIVLGESLGTYVGEE